MIDRPGRVEMHEAKLCSGVCLQTVAAMHTLMVGYLVLLQN